MTDQVAPATAEVDQQVTPQALADDSGAPSAVDEAQEYLKNRRAYVRLRRSRRKQAQAQVLKELEVTDRRMREEERKIARALERLTPLAGWFRYSPVTPRVAEQIAMEEFGRLARMPGITAITADSEQQWILVTVREPEEHAAHQDGRKGGGGKVAGATKVRIGLLTPTVHVDGAEWVRHPRASSLGARWLRVRERMLAAELLGAGDLVGLMVEVLPEMSEWLLDNSSEAAESATQQSAVGAPEARAAYVLRRAQALVAHSSADAIRQAQSEIHSASEDVSKLSGQGVWLSRALEGLEEADDSDSEKLGREYDELMEHPGISRIVVGRSRIAVETEPVVLRSRLGQRHLIGEFVIYLKPGRQIEIRNVGRPPAGRKGACDHPHIRSGGGCLGNIRSTVSQLLLQDDLRRLIHLHLEYLYSLNESSTYAAVSRWPEIDADGNIIDDEKQSESEPNETVQG